MAGEPIHAAALPASPAAPPSVKTASRRAAEDFEAFFLSQTMESMFAGVDADKLFGGGQAEGVYRSMLLQEYGKAAARGGGVGIADAVYREMMRLQEKK
jgi:Rod binding domain-containing protein